MWNKDEIKGKADQVKGRVKERVGEMNDDEKLREEGQDDQAKGKVQEGFGTGRRKVGDFIEEAGKDLKR
jgi:uncharacterized protein YjbJ (UPF0337 family)